MEFKVRLFLDERYIDPSEYPTIKISSPVIDRIVNHIYDVNHMDDQIDYSEIELTTDPTLQ